MDKEESKRFTVRAPGGHTSLGSKYGLNSPDSETFDLFRAIDKLGEYEDLEDEMLRLFGGELTISKFCKIIFDKREKENKKFKEALEVISTDIEDYIGG